MSKQSPAIECIINLLTIQDVVNRTCDALLVDEDIGNIDPRPDYFSSIIGIIEHKDDIDMPDKVIDGISIGCKETLLRLLVILSRKEIGESVSVGEKQWNDSMMRCCSIINILKPTECRKPLKAIQILIDDSADKLIGDIASKMTGTPIDISKFWIVITDDVRKAINEAVSRYPNIKAWEPA